MCILNFLNFQMQNYFTIYLLLVFAAPLIYGIDETSEKRDEKLISTFQIVRFPNDACVGTNSRNGTCYTSAECSDKDGTSSGSCADGFGVCCTFVVTICDSTSSENLTYWTNPTTVSAGTCGLTVCPINTDICSMRLDFTSFTITGPSTLTVPAFNRRAGTPYGRKEQNADLTDYGVSTTTNCLYDIFYMQGASPSTNPPAICGENAGFHMYMEADVDRCNRMEFSMATTAGSSLTTQTTRGVTSLATRKWDITISQIECTSVTLPPPGCTQYYWGGTSHILENFNHQDKTDATKNTHLAMQHQRMCIRRERGYCVGCFYTDDAGLKISGDPGTSVHYTQPGGCCGYITVEAGLGYDNTAEANFDLFGAASNGAGQYGFDCIVIPGAFVAANNGGNAAVIFVAQTSALLSQTYMGKPTTNAVPTPSPPAICGSNGNIGIGEQTNLDEAAFEATNEGVDEAGTANEQTICTRIAPFILEFISDDLEGLGGITNADAEMISATQAANQGFYIHHSQVACATTA
jgi:hypothetical protein